MTDYLQRFSNSCSQPLHEKWSLRWHNEQELCSKQHGSCRVRVRTAVEGCAADVLVARANIYFPKHLILLLLVVLGL